MQQKTNKPQIVSITKSVPHRMISNLKKTPRSKVNPARAAKAKATLDSLNTKTKPEKSDSDEKLTHPVKNKESFQAKSEATKVSSRLWKFALSLNRRLLRLFKGIRK